jgi:hypothetical protein
MRFIDSTQGDMEVAAWNWLSDALIAHPEIAIFLALGLGFLVGRLKIKGIALGPVTGTLLAGVLVGILFDGVDIPDLVKTVAFVAFLFALGYNVGPQFFAGLRGDGVKQVVLAIINCVFGLIVVIVLAKALGYGPGWGAGLLAGASPSPPSSASPTPPSAPSPASAARTSRNSSRKWPSATPSAPSRTPPATRRRSWPTRSSTPSRTSSSRSWARSSSPWPTP